ncbi:adenylyl cyclase-associated protein 2-like [Cylas formicarius]|uniref:adenylyl cyclase-associated protein 2-like n=1 Tax=Cylas formicarius TaxID=197179 RepID=UPI002958A787|nr:adenylyl cyclase-associated protein 2-like [Cylas formicarius]
MSVSGYAEVVDGPLAEFLQISRQIGGDVAEQARLVEDAFKAQQRFIQLAGESAQPTESDVAGLLKPTSEKIAAIQTYREKRRSAPHFNHLSAVSESIAALGWVAVSPAPAPYIKEMNDAGQFYTNRVLKDWKEKDKRHVEWVKAWVQTITDLQSFVKRHHTTGLVWAGKGAPKVPPPPPACPPPPPVDLEASGDAGQDRSALFAEINKGSDITKGLKKVTSEMQTHKNTALRQGPAPFKPVARSVPFNRPAEAASEVRPPSFIRDGKKWLIEYQKDRRDLVVDNAEMNNVVYLYRCQNTTVQVKGKINSITMDSCKKTSVVFDSLVSSMEFINCQSVEMQVLGKVPTISIDKTDGCQVYLSDDSLDVVIVSSKSSEMNVLVPKKDGDYTEHAVPEQFRTTITAGKTLQTEIVENKG